MIKRKGQLYWNVEKTVLTEKMFSEMLSDKNEKLYQNALSYFASIRPLISPEDASDFQWIKMEYTVPYFMDLAFRCRNRVFGIMFASLGRDGILSNPPFYEERMRLMEENDITGCILPFDNTGNVVRLVEDKFNLINASLYIEEGRIEEVVPEKLSGEEFRETSLWELYNTAVMAIVENLHNNEGIDNMLYQSYPGVSPNICWIDKDNVFNWMVIDIVKERELKPEMPSELLSTIARNNGLGHYALCELSNPYAPNIFPRGQKFDLRFEITDL